MLKLYYHPYSTFAQRVRIALIEKGLSAELIEVDLPSRAQFSADFLAKNPYARVPAIEDEDGWVLYESTAILEYLELMNPSPPLVPEDVRGRARVALHMKLCDLEVGEPARAILLPKRFLPQERWRIDRMQEAQAKIAKHFVVLESQLQKSEYLVGDRFTLADLCYAPFLQFLPMLEVTAGPATRSWVDRVLVRPSIMQTRPAR